jgi:hypothetical protein
MVSPANNGDTPSEECDEASTYWRINERPLHISPYSHLRASISLFNISTQSVSLIMDPTPDVEKKQINNVLSMDLI